MTIAPLSFSIEVAAPPRRAFELFAGDIGRWWPRGSTIGHSPHADIVIEPREGGRWFEIDDRGAETPWGKVLRWEPPARLVLGWQLNSRFAFDPELVTEVELMFTASDVGTRVTLVHRDLERFGADADKLAGQLGGGWPKFLNYYKDSISSTAT